MYIIIVIIIITARRTGHERAPERCPGKGRI